MCLDPKCLTRIHARGNLTYDGRKGMSVNCNILHLAQRRHQGLRPRRRRLRARRPEALPGVFRLFQQHGPQHGQAHQGGEQRNVEFVKQGNNHLEKHGGNYRNETHGPLISR